MQGNIQIEVLNEQAVMIAAHLKDVSDFDKQVLVMSLANALDIHHVPRFPRQSQTSKSGFIEQPFHP